MDLDGRSESAREKKSQSERGREHKPKGCRLSIEMLQTLSALAFRNHRIDLRVA